MIHQMYLCIIWIYMQDVLKKYKDPHIYTAFIKYSSLISIHDQQMTTVVSYIFQMYVSSKCVRYYLRELPDPLFCSAFARSNQLLYIFKIAQHSGSKLSWRAFTFVRPQMFFVCMFVLTKCFAGSGQQQTPSKTIVVGWRKLIDFWMKFRPPTKETLSFSSNFLPNWL